VTARPAYIQRYLLGLCVVLAAAAPLCLFLGARGFAPVVGAAGLLCIPFARPTREDWKGVLILAALVLWAAIGIAWSPAPNLRLPDSAKALSRFTILHLALQLVFCTALVTALGSLSRARASKALTWIAAGFLVVVALLIEEGLTNLRLYSALLARFHFASRPDRLVSNMAQGGYVVAVVAWPLAVGLYRRGRGYLAPAVVLLAFAPLSMVLLRGVAPTVGLVASLPVFFLVLRRGPGGARVLGVITAVYAMAAPLVMLAAAHRGLYARFKVDLPPSWYDRLRIWSFVAERMKGPLLRGAGLEASRTFPGVVPLHPHNAPLQLWYELGLPGALLGVLFWLWLWRRIGDCARRDRILGATAAAVATVYLIISAVSFGQWQEWWLCVGGFAMALCVLLGATLAPDEAAAPGPDAVDPSAISPRSP
jgi:O-antigen ligase